MIPHGRLRRVGWFEPKRKLLRVSSDQLLAIIRALTATANIGEYLDGALIRVHWIQGSHPTAYHVRLTMDQIKRVQQYESLERR